MRSGRGLGALHEGGHLLGAVFKPKYASPGGSPAIDPSVLDANEALVYPVIGMKEVSNDSGGGRYVKLRNPFSKIGDNVTKAKEWEGPWGSSRAGAAEWSAHPGVASELGGKPRDSSTFWMSFEDFVSGFNKVHICRLVEQPVAAACSPRARRVDSGDCRWQGRHAAWARRALMAPQPAVLSDAAGARAPSSSPSPSPTRSSTRTTMSTAT